MAAPRFRVVAVAALLALLGAIAQTGAQPFACAPSVAHPDTCAESCDGNGENAAPDLSSLLCLMSPAGSNAPLMAAGRLVLSLSAMPQPGFQPTVDRPPAV